jgi:hypothetical protein
MNTDSFQGVMSQQWSNAIAMLMALDWGLKCESLNPPYAEFISPKTQGKLKFEIYFTNYYTKDGEAFINTEHIDTQSLGLSHFTVLCIWNKPNNNCVVLKTEDARMLMQNNDSKFPLMKLVPVIKRKFEIGVSKMDDADIPNEAVGQLQEG